MSERWAERTWPARHTRTRVHPAARARSARLNRRLPVLGGIACLVLAGAAVLMSTTPRGGGGSGGGGVGGGGTDAEQFGLLPPPRDAPWVRRIDPGRDTAAELTLLPGVGPRLAAAIVRHRETHGPFATPAALDDVPGIGPRTVAHLTPWLDLPPADPRPVP